MAGKEGEAGRVLDGLAERLARVLIARIEALETPGSGEGVAEVERIARTVGVIARSAASIRRLAREEQKAAASAPETDDMDDRPSEPDDPETIERKYQELERMLERYAGERQRARLERAGASSSVGRGDGPPGPEVRMEAA